MPKKAETKVVEEETKFCKNCGKKLTGDEVCDCAKEQPKKSNEGFDFMKTLVDIKDDAIKSIKKPVDVVEDNAKTEDMYKTYMKLGLIAISFGILLAAILKVLFPLVLEMAGLSSGMMGITSKALEKCITIPYFKFFLFGTIVYALVMVGYAISILAVQAIFKNKKVSFKSALTIACSANLQIVFVNILTALTALLNLDTRAILVIFVVGSMIVNYNFAYSYAKITDIDKNKFAYAIVTLMVIACVISYCVSYVASNTFVKNMDSKDFMSNSCIEDLEDELDDSDWDF